MYAGFARARELRVERLVAPCQSTARPQQEVGEPAPAVLDEDALVDDVDAVAQRLHRLG